VALDDFNPYYSIALKNARAALLSAGGVEVCQSATLCAMCRPTIHAVAPFNLGRLSMVTCATSRCWASSSFGTTSPTWLTWRAKRACVTRYLVHTSALCLRLQLAHGHNHTPRANPHST
jgi:hypothetical protein